MFKTKDDEMAGFSGMFEKGSSVWHSISRDLRTHWYHVSVKKRLEGRFVSEEQMLNDEIRLHQVIGAQNDDYIVTDIQAVTPSWMNKAGAWRMEKLESISIGYDKNEVMVCLLEVENGSVYNDSHDSSVDVTSLTQLRQIYKAMPSCASL